MGLLVGAVVLGATTSGIVGAALPASAEDPHRDTIAVVCDTGIVTEGDISMSAMTLTLTPADAPADVPGGCVTR